MRRFSLLLILVLLLPLRLSGQERRPAAAPTVPAAAASKERPRLPAADGPVAARELLNRRIAARFAPIFYQGLGDHPRGDYIVKFDFDGDWRGDNNWENLNNFSLPLRAYVYFSVTETATHYLVHYAVFHPRDYKKEVDEAATASGMLETLIFEGLRRIGKDPTGGLANQIALAHENDLEGCLVVAEKIGSDPAKAEVRFVETLAHNRFLRYCAGKPRPGRCETIQMEDQHPLVFIEPKGHGQLGYTGDPAQLKGSEGGVLVYSYTGKADNQDLVTSKSIGYDLLPIYDTLWARAQQVNEKGENETYGEGFDFKTRAVLRAASEKDATAPRRMEQKLGLIGSTFRGEVGFKNKARSPWGWFDSSEPDRPQGEWFFDPASVIASHFSLGPEFSAAYVYHPYFRVGP
ncbi:MAG: hypothetical protein ACKVX9_01795 [Blastocatellia bacterium]